MNKRSPHFQFGIVLLGATLVSLGLFGYGALRNHSTNFSYLCWNLILAWLPLLFSLRLDEVLKRKLWSSWEALGFSLLWLLFLPNTFYMISDYIHLQEVRRVNVLYDAVMFTSFVYVAVILGVTSLLRIHAQLRKRLTATAAGVWIAAVLLLCSFGIYLGRDLRWNSWDILTNPGGLLFDISDRLTHPAAYPQMFLIVLSFFALLGSIYALVWRGALLIQKFGIR